MTDALARLAAMRIRYADTGLAQAALAPVANAALGAEGDALLADVRATLDARARKAGLAL